MTPEERKKILGRPATDIYAPGSPTVKAQDKMNAAAGKVADDVAMVTGVKGLNTIGRTLTAPVVNAGQRLASDFSATNQNRERVRQSRASLSAPDSSKFAMGQPQNTAQTPQINNTNPLRNGLTGDGQKQAQFGIGSPRPVPIVGDPEQSIRNSQEWLRANKPGYAPGSVAQNGPAPAANTGLSNPVRPTQSQNIINGIRQSDGVVIAPNGMEVMNGNPRNNLSESRIEENVTPATDLRGFTIPGQFNKETLTFGNPSAIEKSLIASRGIEDRLKQQLGQSNLGAAKQQQEIAAMAFNAQKVLADGNSTPEQIDGAKRVLSAFGEKAEPKVVTNKESGPDGENQYSIVVDPNDPGNSALVSSPEIAGRKKAQALLEMADDPKTFTKAWDSYSEADQRAAIPLLPAHLLKLLLDRE